MKNKFEYPSDSELFPGLQNDLNGWFAEKFQNREQAGVDKISDDVMARINEAGLVESAHHRDYANITLSVHGDYLFRELYTFISNNMGSIIMSIPKNRYCPVYIVKTQSNVNKDVYSTKEFGFRYLSRLDKMWNKVYHPVQYGDDRSKEDESDAKWMKNTQMSKDYEAIRFCSTRDYVPWTNRFLSLLLPLGIAVFVYTIKTESFMGMENKPGTPFNMLAPWVGVILGIIGFYNLTQSESIKSSPPTEETDKAALRLYKYYRFYSLMAENGDKSKLTFLEDIDYALEHYKKVKNG